MTAALARRPDRRAGEFWWLLVSSPEILVFLFFMITDPKTMPASRPGARVYAVAVGLLATLLIAPQTTEFATKVAILGALALVCAARRSSSSLGRRHARARARLGRVPEPTGRAGAARRSSPRSRSARSCSPPGSRARPDIAGAAAAGPRAALPRAIVVAEGHEVASIDQATARAIARDLVADLRTELTALRTRRSEARRDRRQRNVAGLALVADARAVVADDRAGVRRRADRMSLEPRHGQGPPTSSRDRPGHARRVDLRPGTDVREP